MTANPAKTTLAALLAFLLSGCVESATPLITDAQPVFGPDVKLHFYELGDERAKGPEVATFHWDGHEYRVVDNSSLGLAGFAATPLGGNDFVIQSRSTNPKVKILEYTIARRVVNGVYTVSLIEEGAAEAATRAKFCDPGVTDSCRVTSRDGVMALARADATTHEPRGLLAILIGEDKP